MASDSFYCGPEEKIKKRREEMNSGEREKERKKEREKEREGGREGGKERERMTDFWLPYRQQPRYHTLHTLCYVSYVCDLAQRTSNTPTRGRERIYNRAPPV